MPRDRSLDEFFAPGSDADDESEADDEPPASEPESADEPGAEAAPESDLEEPAETEAAVEPKEMTYGWSPDGGECAACGETVDARWRDGDDLVCVDCKNW